MVAQPRTLARVQTRAPRPADPDTGQSVAAATSIHAAPWLQVVPPTDGSHVPPLGSLTDRRGAPPALAVPRQARLRRSCALARLQRRPV